MRLFYASKREWISAGKITPAGMSLSMYDWMMCEQPRPRVMGFHLRIRRAV